MKEVILIKNGELALKGLNRRTFEDIMIKNMRRKLADLGTFTFTPALIALIYELTISAISTFLSFIPTNLVAGMWAPLTKAFNQNFTGTTPKNIAIAIIITTAIDTPIQSPTPNIKFIYFSP